MLRGSIHVHCLHRYGYTYGYLQHHYTVSINDYFNSKDAIVGICLVPVGTSFNRLPAYYITYMWPKYRVIVYCLQVALYIYIYED